MKTSVEKLALDKLITHMQTTLNPFLSWRDLTILMYPDLTGFPLRAAIIQTKQRKQQLKELATANGYTLVSNWNEERTRYSGIKLAKVEDIPLIDRELKIMEKNKEARVLSIARYASGALRLREKATQLQIELV